jgi:hypothetical protein
VEWTAADDHGNRELQGVPEALVRRFSKRTDQIDQAVQELAADGRERTPRLVKWPSVAGWSLDPSWTTSARDASSCIAATSREGSIDALAVLDEQPPGQFTLPEFGIERLLAPGQQTSVSVAFTPSGRGPARAMFAVDLVSATDQPGVTYRRRYRIPLTASAQMPTLFLARGPRLGPITPPSPLTSEAPVLVGPLAPQPPPSAPREAELTLLDFGVAPAGELVVRSLWLRNVGDEVLTIGLLQPLDLSRLAVSNPASFPTALPPGGEMEVALQYSSGFVPGLRGQSELRIYSDDPLRPEAVLQVVIRAAGPHFVEPPEVIDLGTVTPGTGTVVTFSSDGTQPVSVSEVRLATGRDFVVSGTPTLPAQVASGSSLTLAVALVATAPGPYQEQLVVEHDGNRTRRSSVLLRATSA